MAERDIQHEIILATSHLVAWFRNSVGVANVGGRVIRYGIGGKGGSDLIGIRRSDGRFVACEVKDVGKNPRPEQIAFLELVAGCGGLAFWADSVEDAIRELEVWG